VIISTPMNPRPFIGDIVSVHSTRSHTIACNVRHANGTPAVITMNLPEANLLHDQLRKLLHIPKAPGA
jgi:hypothetical protein